NSLVLFDINQERVARNILLDNAGPQAVGLAENKLYISADNSDSILILNRTSLEKIKSLPAGDDPGAVSVYNQKVFIANYAYDHYDAESYTSYYNQGTVTVVDAVADTIAATIKVGMNPSALLTEQDLIYVLCTGDYGSKNSWIYRINPTSLKVIDSLNLETTGVTKITSDRQGNLYSVAFSYNTMSNTIISYNRGLEKSSLKTFCNYGDGITFTDDHILICKIPDYATPGTLMILQNDLSVVDSVQVGIGPSQIINE
ncbi:MAG: hypothetical protein KBA26_03305, partial [Candidatus Delongbacteria bacterium]|nr:hypothetical protein [Candidatus Delongbacteria bacterium]